MAQHWPFPMRPPGVPARGRRQFGRPPAAMLPRAPIYIGARILPLPHARLRNDPSATRYDRIRNFTPRVGAGSPFCYVAAVRGAGATHA